MADARIIPQNLFPLSFTAGPSPAPAAAAALRSPLGFPAADQFLGSPAACSPAGRQDVTQQLLSAVLKLLSGLASLLQSLSKPGGGAEPPLTGSIAMAPGHSVKAQAASPINGTSGGDDRFHR